MPDILGTKQGIAALSKFLERSGAFTKSGTGLPRWKPPTMEDSLAAEHDMEDPEGLRIALEPTHHIKPQPPLPHHALVLSPIIFF